MQIPPTHHRGRPADLSTPSVLVDADFTVVDGSPVIESLLGVPRQELVGAPLGRWIERRSLELSPRRMAALGGAYLMGFLDANGASLAVNVRVEALSADGGDWGIWVDRVVDGTIDLTRGGSSERSGEVEVGEATSMDSPSTI